MLREKSMRYTPAMAESSFYIQVKPKATQNSVQQTSDGVLVRVTAPPVDGAANIAVIKLLAQTLRVPKSTVTIAAGSSGRLKRITISGLAQDELQQRLANLAIPKQK